MSWDIDLYARTECGQLVHVDEANYTYNVAPMFFNALGGDGIRQFAGMKAVDAIPILNRGIRKMKENPGRYRAMNPPNGWGDYEGALELLEWMLRKCEQYPSIEITVL